MCLCVRVRVCVCVLGGSVLVLLDKFLSDSFCHHLTKQATLNSLGVGGGGGGSACMHACMRVCGVVWVWRRRERLCVRVCVSLV